MTKILLATQYFPFSVSNEVFLRNEIKSLPKDCILHIFPGQMKDNEFIDENLKNVSNIFFNIDCISDLSFYKKLYYIVSSVFSQIFFKELIIIIKGGKFKFRKIKKMMYCLMVANHYNHKLEKSKIAVDIVYSYWLNYYVLGLIKYAKKRSIKIVSRVHGHDLYNEATSYNYHPFREYMLSSLDFCLPISTGGLNYLKNLYNGTYKVFYLGTMDGGLNPIKSEDDEYHFVSCSSIISLKRVDLIFNVLSSIQHKKIKWTHFGDGLMRTELEKLIYNSRTKIDVNLIGHVDSEHIYDFYSNNHIECFINLSTTEGIPVSMMEASSFGIPIIATNVGSVDEIVYNGINGFLIDDIFDSTAILQTVNKFLRMSHLEHHNMREKARLIWESKYNAKINYNRFYMFLKEVVRGEII